MVLRRYGNSGPVVIVLHGGPAAVGDVAPIAKGLSDAFVVFEPWQRGSGIEPLTVARHVEDLHALILEHCPDLPPALVGHSWGAMLALCYAAAHPSRTGPLILVGCGTFDRAARERMKDVLDIRIDENLRTRLAELAASISDPADFHMRKYKLLRDLFVYDRAEPWPDRTDCEPLDIRAHDETWRDMMRLQSDGTYPAAFSAIESPVLMLHGAYDPHPGKMIHDSLRPFIRRLEYLEWERCGHSPWLEKSVGSEFFATMKAWLASNCSKPAAAR